jgi:divalent metal cation (Fe/Co/Zn/Cd) transporter
MRSPIVAGLVLMVLGSAGVAHRVTYSAPQESKAGDDAAVANSDTHEVPPWVGAAVVVGGLTLIAIGATGKPAGMRPDPWH